jgi:hypothetical protein
MFRRWLTLLSALTVAVTAAVSLAPASHANVPGSTLYSPSSSTEGMAYTRMIRLGASGASNGTLLASFEHWSTTGSTASYVIRRSSDDGASWSTLSTVPADTFAYQPFLFEYPQTLGAFPAGTLLLVGATLPSNRAGVTFREWRSADHGATWTYVGAPQTSAGADGSGIWEPFVGLDSSGRMNMYFSDERQSATYSQFLSHIVSTDGGTSWSANPDGSTRVAPGEVKDVASTIQADRPGMVTIAKVPTTGTYVMSFEDCGPANCVVHTKTSSDGNTWGSGPTDLGTTVQTDDGRQLQSTPVIAWSPAGGPNGELLLSSRSEIRVAGGAPENGQVLFVNTNSGSGSWSWMPAPVAVPTAGAPAACGVNYSPELLPSVSGTTVRYSAAGVAGTYNCQELTGSANAGVLPYASPFGGGGDAGWVRYGGGWSVSGGEYTETTGGTGGNKAITGSTGWTDYTVAGDVKVNSFGANGNAGFLLRATDPTTGADNLNGYYVGVTSSAIQIGRESYGWTQLASAAIPGGLAANAWYHLTASVTGCVLSVQGTPAGSWANPVYVSINDCALSHGAVGVRDYDATASWRNISVAAARPVTGPGSNTKCADVNTNTNTNGNAVQLYDCGGVPGQRWSALPDGTLRSFGKCLDVVGNGTANFAKAELWDCNGVGGQQWTPRTDGSLYNPQSGRCLDDPSGVVTNGTQLQIYDCNGQWTQVWHLG